MNKGFQYVSLLVMIGGMVVHAKSASKLCIASENGDIEEVWRLVEDEHVDIDGANEYGETPLLCATRNGQREVVEYLVGRGADVEAECDNGGFALAYACAGADQELIALFPRSPHDINSYAALGSLDEVMQLFDEWENEFAGSAMTPLHWAAYGGRLEVVKYLIEQRGMSAGVLDNIGCVPLHYAAEGGHIDVIKYFIEQRLISPDVVSNSDWSALHVASKGGRLPVVKYLIQECGLEMRATTAGNMSPLALAASSGHAGTVKYLIEKLKGEVGEAAPFAVSPLHSVLQIECPFVMSEMLQCFCNTLGEQAFEWAMLDAVKCSHSEGGIKCLKDLYKRSLNRCSKNVFQVIELCCECIWGGTLGVDFCTMGCSFAEAVQGRNFELINHLLEKGISKSVFGGKLDDSVSLRECMTANTDAMVDETLKALFGHRFLDYREQLQGYITAHPEDAEKSKATLKKIEQKYATHVWEMLPLEVKVLILHKFVEGELMCDLKLSTAQVCLLALCAVHPDEKFDFLTNNYDELDTATICSTMFFQLVDQHPNPLPPPALSYVGQRLLLE